jgi:hypothetical protein
MVAYDVTLHWLQNKLKLRFKLKTGPVLIQKLVPIPVQYQGCPE